jgi:hypothetical protein
MCPDGQPSEEEYGEKFHLWDLSGRVWEVEVFNLSLTFITLLIYFRQVLGHALSHERLRGVNRS